MEKLFLIHIGGKVEGANIEVHDIQCAVGNEIEDTFDYLKKNWYGELKSLHIDSYKVLNTVDGYEVDLNGESDLCLFLVQIGGYHSDVHHEFHKTALMVGKDHSEVRKRVSVEVFGDYDKQHIDSIVNLSNRLIECGVKLGFVETENECFDSPDWFGFMRVQ